MITGLKRMIGELPKPVRLFWGLNVILSLLCLAIMRGNKYLFHGIDPYVSPVLPFNHWIDFICYDDRFKYLHRPEFFSSSLGVPFTYPAAMALVYKLFYFPSHHHLPVFLGITGCGVLLLGRILGLAMIRRGISSRATWFFLAITACVSYPLWFEFMLGNMEICVFLIVAAGLIAVTKNHLYLAACAFGIASSLKIFPFVYLALLLSKKKYKEVALGVAVAAIVNRIALWVVCPSKGVANHGISAGLEFFRLHYALKFLPYETGFDHSLFGFIKRLFALGHVYSMPSLALTAYLVVVSVTGVALYFGRIRTLPLLNQVLCLCIASILLPPTSHDYTLLHLYVPWGLMLLYCIDRWRAGLSVDGLASVFVCFGILLSAESELIFHSGFSAQVKAVALVALLVIGLRNPWCSGLDEVIHA